MPWAVLTALIYSYMFAESSCLGWKTSLVCDSLCQLLKSRLEKNVVQKWNYIGISFVWETVIPGVRTG